ncbi:hypothetical protein E2L08_15840 [Palleronia sediminis]|uniref:Ion channel n=1 Tax=Palleronia sediminis TaxID=2547833 RepID=A0A4R5ZXG6_9RHOB|nr:hypothetical protein [Palleronia sediminis]TDL74882.1 hypothetical protein E2L08_15840 [Palleronia sediminis]
MTEPILFILGAGVVAAVFYDFLRTTIALNGLGPFSYILTKTFWALAKRVVPFVERRFGMGLRGAVGPSILVVIAFFWIVFHLIGYTLMFSAGPSLVDSETDEPATLIQTVAYAGSAISTLGASTVAVTNGWWDNLSMIAAVNGMIVLTLSVSFILSVLQTTVTARVFATRYNALMSRAENRDKPKTLERTASLGDDLCEIAVNLAASPLPAFFSPHDRSMDFPVALKELGKMLDAEGLTARDDTLSSVDVSQLRWGLGLLGRSQYSGEAGNDFQAAMAWADYHILDDQRSDETVGA